MRWGEEDKRGTKGTQYSTRVLVGTSRKLVRREMNTVQMRSDTQQQRKRFILFDLDSTLIQNECIDLLARHHGCGHQIAQITNNAMEGNVDFDSSLRKRVELLKGMKWSTVEKTLKEIQLTSKKNQYNKNERS